MSPAPCALQWSKQAWALAWVLKSPQFRVFPAQEHASGGGGGVSVGGGGGVSVGGGGGVLVGGGGGVLVGGGGGVLVGGGGGVSVGGGGGVSVGGGGGVLVGSGVLVGRVVLVGSGVWEGACVDVGDLLSLSPPGVSCVADSSGSVFVSKSESGPQDANRHISAKPHCNNPILFIDPPLVSL